MNKKRREFPTAFFGALPNSKIREKPFVRTNAIPKIKVPP